jgi:hypothetical protein
LGVCWKEGLKDAQDSLYQILNKKKVFNNNNDGFKAMHLEKQLGHVPVHGKTKARRTVQYAT